MNRPTPPASPDLSAVRHVLASPTADKSVRAARTLVVWCPDWPVIAAARAAEVAGPVVVTDRGLVYACDAVAREAGVRRGLRTREAQARCPDLAALPYDPAVAAREFEPVALAVEALVPRVEIIRPGLLAIPARGPARYFGGEQNAADTVGGRLAGMGVEARTGLADGPFAAEQAARETSRQPARKGACGAVTIWPQGAAARYLAGLPVDVLDRPELADLLRRLGIRTLGAFAALPAAEVLTRFGTDGARAHRLASGRGERPLATRRPPPELAVDVELDPPVDRADTVAFTMRDAADRLVAGLTGYGLVCTCLRIEVATENGAERERLWRHPRWFSAADVVDRVRWQLTPGTSGEATSELAAAVIRVRLVPEEVDRAGAQQEGLWGDQVPDDRIHHALTRVQSILGREGVVTAVRSGGRGAADRVTLVPWGDRAEPYRPVEPPWPGHLPAPTPPTVLLNPCLAIVRDAAGDPVEVDERSAVSVPPARFGVDEAHLLEVVDWAGPWPVDERWWDERAARRCARFQVVSADGRAWLVTFEDGRWWVVGCYD